MYIIYDNSYQLHVKRDQVFIYSGSNAYSRDIKADHRTRAIIVLK
jgi:hypothetical protein